VCNFISASSEDQTIGSVVLIYSIVMAPKKTVVASRRSIRAIVREPKASSDSRRVDMLSASAEIVVGSAEDQRIRARLSELKARSSELCGDPRRPRSAMNILLLPRM